MKKERNSFEATVEMFADMGADSVLVRDIDGEIAIGDPYDSKTGKSWSITMISSLDELKECKYKKAVPDELVKAYGKTKKINTRKVDKFYHTYIMDRKKGHFEDGKWKIDSLKVKEVTTE